MRFFLKLLFLLPCLLQLDIATAQQINTVKLDSLFNILSSKNLMMGSVAISKGDKIVYKKSFGYSYFGKDKKVSADENTKYRIGSITKLFTSVMIFQLVDEKKLSLQTKLSTFFPKIKNASKITVADMMHHRSGIHDAVNDTAWQSKIFSAKSENDVLHILQQLPSDFEPDTKSAYSNSNFSLLGYIIEKLDKDSYAASLKKRITDKLHLKNTYVGREVNSAKNEALPYFFQNNLWTTSEEVLKIDGNNAIAAGGAGAIVSTPTDLTIFLNALFDKKIISAENLTKDTTIKGKFGMDMFKIPFYHRYAWGHNGKIGGFIAELYKFVNDDITVAICFNGVNYTPNDVMIDLLSCCFNVPFSLSKFNPSIIQVDKTVLQKYIGNYASKILPLKVKIFIKDNQLFAQATGQGAFPLSAVSEKEFIFKQAGIDILFDADKKQFILKQGGGAYLFQKE